MDINRRIRNFNAGRDRERLQLKYQRMRQDPFEFLRGTCHLFYDRVPRSGIFRSAPLTWVCGDLHLENFGSYKGDNRLVYFDMNDFDEAALAPASWELVRLLSSLRVGLQVSSANKPNVRRLCERFIDTYAAALRDGKAYWVERETARGSVRNLLDKVRSRDRRSFLATHTQIKGKRRVLRVDGKHALLGLPRQFGDGIH